MNLRLTSDRQGHEGQGVAQAHQGVQQGTRPVPVSRLGILGGSLQMTCIESRICEISSLSSVSFFFLYWRHPRQTLVVPAAGTRTQPQIPETRFPLVRFSHVHFTPLESSTKWRGRVRGCISRAFSWVGQNNRAYTTGWTDVGGGKPHLGLRRQISCCFYEREMGGIARRTCAAEASCRPAGWAGALDLGV